MGNAWEDERVIRMMNGMAFMFLSLSFCPLSCNSLPVSVSLPLCFFLCPSFLHLSTLEVYQSGAWQWCVLSFNYAIYCVLDQTKLFITSVIAGIVGTNSTSTFNLIASYSFDFGNTRNTLRIMVLLMPLFCKQKPNFFFMWLISLVYDGGSSWSAEGQFFNSRLSVFQNRLFSPSEKVVCAEWE